MQAIISTNNDYNLDDECLVFTPVIPIKDLQPKVYPRVSAFSPLCDIHIFLPCSRNLREAVLSRMFYHKVDGVVSPIEAPDSKDIFPLKHFISELCAKARWRIPPMDEQTFLEHAPDAKRKLYAQTIEEMLTDPLKERDGNVMAFIKEEKKLAKHNALLLSSFTTAYVYNPADNIYGNGNPRLIQPRSTRFHVVYARFICSIEKSIFKIINKYFAARHPAAHRITVMKGYNADKTGTIIHEKWNRFVRPVWLALDATRFSGHMSTPLWEQVFRLYDRMLALTSSERKLFNRLKRMVISCEGRFYAYDGKGKYRPEGKLTDGLADTGLVAVIVVCGMFYELLTKLQVDFEVVDMGDDCGVIIEEEMVKRVVAAIPPWFAKFGFVYKLEDIIYEFNKIKFCQCHPIFNDNRQTYTMVRNPFTVLCKDTLVMHANETPEYSMGVLKSIAVGGLASSSDLPIVGPFYKRLYNDTFKYKVVRDKSSYIRDMLYKDIKSHGPITENLRLQYFIAFGVSVGEQIEIEEHVRTFPCLYDFSGSYLDCGLTQIPDI